MRRNEKAKVTKVTENTGDINTLDEIVEKKKKGNKFVWVISVLFCILLIIGFAAQTGYFVYSNFNLLSRQKTPPPVEVATPKEEIVFTEYEKQTDAAVKAFPTFNGDKKEAIAVAEDFSTKYLTMSNLKTQLDFLGKEYIYPNPTVEKNFRDYTLTNYYYHFPEIKMKYGADEKKAPSTMPEIIDTKILTIDKETYIHSDVQKDEGYRFALGNDLEKSQEFMNEKFEGYRIDLGLTYAGGNLAWMKTAPEKIEVVVLLDNKSQKWFVAEFHLASNVNDEIEGELYKNPTV